VIELSVVSGTYNRLPMLKRMISSTRASMRGISYEIILVDGGSTDGTQAWCKQQPDIRLIEHGRLLGCNKAYADGAAAASGEFVVFANDDLAFVGDSIARSVAFMRHHGDVGIGLFLTNRTPRIYGPGWHNAMMPAHWPDGTMVSIPYNGVIITPRWFGNRLGWWSLPGARSYGGDNYFVANALEAGWAVTPIQDAFVDEPDVDDELKQINNVPQSESHPDSTAYLKLYPRGPELGHPRQFEAPIPPKRILYAPIYERGHVVQHQQKRGLRRALQRLGVVREIDYVQFGADALLSVARDFLPDLVLTQFHSGDSFGATRTAKLKALVPQAKLVNWNGDVWDKPDDAAYVEMLHHFDLHTTTNLTAARRLSALGVACAYWQIGYEPDGVGTAQKPTTDVVLLGNGYSDQRRALGSFLLSLPHKTALYGNNWQGQAHGDTTYDFKRGRDILNRARVVIGDGQYADAYGFVSNRLFQSLAAGGALLLHQEFPGMTELLGFVSGVHLVSWTDHADLADKLSYYLDPAHEAERAKIARAGQLECLKHHSFEVRVRQLFEMLSQMDAVVPDNAVLGSEHA